MFHENKSLKLGKIVYGKNGKKELKGQDFSVHYQLNIVLAVFIRDSLKIFLDKTPALPKTANPVLDDLLEKVQKRIINSEEYDKMYEKTSDELFVKWKGDLQDVINAFDNYIELYYKIEDNGLPSSDVEKEKFYNDFAEQGKTAFNMLANIYDDLEY